jgi:hypothetical protein
MELARAGKRSWLQWHWGLIAMCLDGMQGLRGISWLGNNVRKPSKEVFSANVARGCKDPNWVFLKGSHSCASL